MLGGSAFGAFVTKNRVGIGANLEFSAARREDIIHLAVQQLVAKCPLRIEALARRGAMLVFCLLDHEPHAVLVCQHFIGAQFTFEKLEEAVGGFPACVDVGGHEDDGGVDVSAETASRARRPAYSG